jgi:hypothetical protein
VIAPSEFSDRDEPQERKPCWRREDRRRMNLDEVAAVELNEQGRDL